MKNATERAPCDIRQAIREVDRLLYEARTECAANPSCIQFYWDSLCRIADECSNNKNVLAQEIVNGLDFSVAPAMRVDNFSRRLVWPGYCPSKSSAIIGDVSLNNRIIMQATIYRLYFNDNHPLQLNQDTERLEIWVYDPDSNVFYEGVDRS